MRPVLGLVLALCACLRLAGQSTSTTAPPNGATAVGKTAVVLCSIAPLASWAANVAGTRARVEILLPADVGPHDFQFRPRDLKRIQAADLIVINGLGIEDWLDRPLRANARNLQSKLVRTSDGLKQELIYEIPELALDQKSGGAKSGKHKHGHDHDHDHDHDHAGAGEMPNPHVWLDPVLARHGVSNILAGLVRVDPAGAAIYRQNAAAYLTRLDALDAEVKAAVGRLPHRAVVTFHDAFPYFIRRYGLELVGVIEETPGVEPSPKYIAELLKVVRARQVKAIFTEPQFSPRLAKRLADDLKVAVGELDVLETGQLSAAFYEDGIRRNLKVLENHLK